MALNQIDGGLRTIHNGSINIAKATIGVPPGGELTVPADVADQMLRDGAFKEGSAPAETLAALAALPVVVDNILIDPAAFDVVTDAVAPAVTDAVAPAVADPPVVAKPAKKPAAKKG